MWSDSCIAQNKNQMISTAILKFMSDHLQIKSIVQKFSEPGHSQIQEVDCVHSALDKYLKPLEIHSILSLVNYLKNVETNKIKLKIIEMQFSDFKNFSRISNQLNFSIVPFTKIKLIQYIQNNLFQISYKNSILQSYFQLAKILKKGCRNQLSATLNIFKIELDIIKKKERVKNEKISDLKLLFNLISEIDKNYYLSQIN